MELKKGDSVATLRSDMSVQIITTEAPSVVECSALVCDKCPTLVASWSREELEERYLKLLTIRTKV